MASQTSMRAAVTKRATEMALVSGRTKPTRGRPSKVFSSTLQEPPSSEAKTCSTWVKVQPRIERRGTSWETDIFRTTICISESLVRLKSQYFASARWSSWKAYLNGSETPMLLRYSTAKLLSFIL